MVRSHKDAIRRITDGFLSGMAEEIPLAKEAFIDATLRAFLAGDPKSLRVIVEMLEEA
jgi:hypothetical protein